jgi:hypothetical protein
MCCKMGVSGWLMVAAAALAGAAAYDLWPESPNYVVDEPDRVFAGLPVGETLQYTYRIRNLTSKPMRVVGAEYT